MIDIHPELARAILERFPAGVALISDDGHVVWINESLALMLKEPAEGIIGRAVSSLSLPPFADASNEPVPLSETEKRRSDSETRIDVHDSLVSISRTVDVKGTAGQILMVVDRGHALVSFLNALTSGDISSESNIGLLSTNAIRQRLENEISRSRRYANPLSCILIRFDQRTGMRGRIDPDKASQTIAEIKQDFVDLVKSHIRWVDVIGNWDDTAIVLMLPETSEHSAYVLRRKLESLANKREWHPLSSRPVHWGCSSWRKGDDVNRLVRRADNRRERRRLKFK